MRIRARDGFLLRCTPPRRDLALSHTLEGGPQDASEQYRRHAIFLESGGSNLRRPLDMAPGNQCFNLSFPSTRDAVQRLATGNVRPDTDASTKGAHRNGARWNNGFRSVLKRREEARTRAVGRPGVRFRQRGRNRVPQKVEWSLYSVKKCLTDTI